MIKLLKAAYNNPTQKFCYYGCNNNPQIAGALGFELWDWTPQQTLNIEPYYWNTHTIALSLGCKPIFTSEGKEWIEPCISDVSQIKDFIIPDVRNGRTGEILSIIEKMLLESNSDTLIRLPDIQSPLGVAELMMGEALYMALLINPEELHELLEKITTFIIKYILEIQKVCGNRLNALCHPQNWYNEVGYYISDDTNSMVSPEMHIEFSVKYIDRITEKCGPVLYHSCTWTPQYIENMKSVRNKKMINWSVGSSIDPAEIIKEMSGKVLLAPHIGANVHKEEGITKLGLSLKDEYEVVKYFLDSLQENTTMYMNLHESLLEKKEILIKIYNLFHEYGYSPQASLSMGIK